MSLPPADHRKPPANTGRPLAVVLPLVALAVLLGHALTAPAVLATIGLLAVVSVLPFLVLAVVVRAAVVLPPVIGRFRRPVRAVTPVDSMPAGANESGRS